MNIQKLTFHKFCVHIGALPTSYIESLSYYELLLWFCKYLEETVIPTVNHNGEVVTELQTIVSDFITDISTQQENYETYITNLYNQLKNYVDNYFENLDVQNEINNKLDEMAEDGTLENILLNFTNLQKTFNTCVDMKNDQSLKAGQKVKTLGYYSINDGGQAEYYISNTSSGLFEELQNGLYAILIVKNNTVNIKSLGAKGDNETNDTLVFQKAINYFTHSGIIFVPVGTYLIDHLEITTGGIHIMGVSNSHHANEFTLQSNLKAINENNIMIYTHGSQNYANYNFGFKMTNITIDGNNLTKNGVLCEFCSNIKFDNVRITKFNGYGLNLQDVYDSLFDSISLSVCGINETTGALIMHGNTSTTNATRITNSRFENNNYSLQLLSAINQIIFSNTKFEVGQIGNDKTYCIGLTSGIQVVFDSCIFTATPNQYLITALQSVNIRSHVSITNSIFTCANGGENGGKFVDLTNTRGVLISNNTVFMGNTLGAFKMGEDNSFINNSCDIRVIKNNDNELLIQGFIELYKHCLITNNNFLATNYNNYEETQHYSYLFKITGQKNIIKNNNYIQDIITGTKLINNDYNTINIIEPINTHAIGVTEGTPQNFSAFQSSMLSLSINNISQIPGGYENMHLIIGTGNSPKTFIPSDNFLPDLNDTTTFPAQKYIELIMRNGVWRLFDKLKATLQ